MLEILRVRMIMGTTKKGGLFIAKQKALKGTDIDEGWATTMILYALSRIR